MITLAADGKEMNVKINLVPGRGSIVREELEALRRDFGCGMAGEMLV